MIKKLLALVVLAIGVNLSAQSVYPDYQDGKIWFQVKDDVRITASLKDDHYNLPLATLPFLPELAKSHPGAHLSRPFHAAKNSPILQRTFLLTFNDHANVMQIISDLKSTGQVVYAERVPLDRPTLTPNDPSYSSQWHLNVINASGAWNYFSSGSTIKIAIVDDALQRSHPDLSGNLWVNPGEIPNNNIDDDGNGYIDDINGYDVGSNDNNPDPPSSSFSHGTHVAGCASATTNNNTGVAAIGFSCKLIAVKATTQASVVTNGYDGIVYAVAAGADVINMSWGGTGSSTTAQNIISWANGQGVVLVAAAGNNNTNTMFYPAGYTQCIAVAATSSNDVKASFSNYGTWVDISAPGNNIYATTVNSTYGNMSGTSMASPIVAGLAGLMLSLNPTLLPSDIRTCITSTATNINSQNPSYTGQLGAGRINANNAMNCIAATLNWPPVADFTANITTVTAGGSVIFTNQSLYNPTTYSWTFQGGTPGTFNGANPPTIVYNTPGTYNVTLTVSSANGSDTETRTGYITVVAASGCTRVNLPAPSNWTPVNYYTGSSVGSDGWINGMNTYLDREKAMYFDASSQPYTQLVNVWVAFGLAYSANQNKIVNVKVYDGTSGTPGAQIGTAVGKSMGEIMQDVNGNYYSEFSFVNNPITLPVSKRFFVSVDLTNLQWTTGTKDTLSIVSNTAGQTTPSAIWERQSNNNWYQYTTAGSWNLSASLYIHPFLTSQNTVAQITPSATSICAGNSISFDAAGSTYQDTLLWYFPNASPLISNNVVQSVNFNNPGAYNAILYVVGGGCNLFDSAFVSITVNPNPVVNVTSTATTVCPSTPVTITASGASSYVWSPGTFLNQTTGASVISTPTTSITYNVQGTGANGCVTNANVVIQVDEDPVAALAPSDSVICINETITFDGSNSANAMNYSWSFPGGTPSTSNASSPVVLYPNAGTFTAQLIVTNSCGADTITFNNIGVGCVGMEEHNNAVSAFYNGTQHELMLQLPSASANRMMIVRNSLGQDVYARSLNGVSGPVQVALPSVAAGVYYLMVTAGDEKFVMKFVVE